MRPPVITIDGPSGSGKGTISRRLAAELGWHWLDSGALYRLVALAALRHGLPFDDPPSLADAAYGLDVRFGMRSDGEAEVWLEGREVSHDLRTEACGDAASRVAAVPEVRAALLQRQRNFRQSPGLVADGRDMGTVVFPDAPLKVFLTASQEERARRRFNQLKEQGLSANLHDLLDELARRDERDANRAVAPLKPADDALVIDSTSIGIDEVVDRVRVMLVEKGIPVVRANDSSRD
ncbi:MAG: (d)CMP kinase [Chromatiales bacterium]|jgi:cytidylate kinase|nr:(d)CMP kinase [Chromatiales bacterium]MDX9765710.1 (d)CMP kinase [Ectothiorhodospiraceae bacterium]